MIKRIHKKIQSPKGETLTETLTAMLIVVLASAMLAASIVTSSRLNQKAKDYNAEFQKVIQSESNVEQIPGNTSVTIRHDNQGTPSEERLQVNEYKTKDKNHYIYYELPEND